MFGEKQEILQIPRIPVKVLRGNNIPCPLVVCLAGQGHPSLEGRYTPWVSAQESRQTPVLFVTNANKMAFAVMAYFQ